MAAGTGVLSLFSKAPTLNGSPLKYMSAKDSLKDYRPNGSFGTAAENEYARIQRAKGGQNVPSARSNSAHMIAMGQGFQIPAIRSRIQNNELLSHADLGWSAQAAMRGVQFNIYQGPKPHTQETYPLGRLSQSFMDRFGHLAGKGIQSELGWRGTLAQAGPSKSTEKPTSMFKREVYQTLETRLQTIQYANLPGHSRESRLNPRLSTMYQEKKEVGAVRKSFRRVT